MSDIEPKRAGKCWSCKYCEDVGTYGYEDSTFYMRKCNHSSKEYVADCERYCSDYVWDGTTTEYWKDNSSSSSSYSSSSSSSSDGGGCMSYIVGLVVLAVIGIIGFIGLGTLSDFIIEKQKKDTPVTQVTETKESSTAKIIPSEGLRLRSGAGTSYQKILTMPKGATVKVIKTEGEWAYVDYNGTKGWCSLEYLDMN